ncbi:MAG: MFS transporter [Phycisphaerae bacterium]|nr:MFS transporter [Phycisphaerae bacterium]
MPPSTPVARVGPTPAALTPVFVITFLNSVGTGVVQNGIYFITREAYGFGPLGNYALGTVLGVAYVLGAFAAGRIVEGLRRRLGLTSRGTLAWTIAILGLLCPVPMLAERMGLGQGAIWPMIFLYSGTSGLLWPLIESYVSGGRSGPGLRRAIARWNVVWSAAVLLAFWAMAPLMKTNPLVIVALLGVVQGGSALLVWRLPADPPLHDHDAAEPHPPVYERLLTAFRLLLPTSYLVLCTLGPYLPEAIARMGVSAAWATPLASVWLAARVGTFIVMGRLKGWHGRWLPAVQGAVLMLAGFGICVLAPRVADGWVGLGVLAAGLACFGTGMATIYSAALYYAMAVGKAAVGAGGTHETLIGLGYTVGPALGLLASSFVETGWIARDRLEPMLLTGIGVVAVLVGVEVARRIHRNTRPPRDV